MRPATLVCMRRTAWASSRVSLIDRPSKDTGGPPFRIASIMALLRNSSRRILDATNEANSKPTSPAPANSPAISRSRPATWANSASASIWAMT